MSDRNAKIRRLVATGLPHSKLVGLIKRLRGHPLDESISRDMLRRSPDELWAATGCVLNLQSMGGKISWDLLSLPKNIAKVRHKSSSSSADVARTVPPKSVHTH